MVKTDWDDVDWIKMRKLYFEKYPDDKQAFDDGVITPAIDRRVRKFYRDNGIPTARELHRSNHNE
jgi:hypothetical protein